MRLNEKQKYIRRSNRLMLDMLASWAPDDVLERCYYYSIARILGMERYALLSEETDEFRAEFEHFWKRQITFGEPEAYDDEQ